MNTPVRNLNLQDRGMYYGSEIPKPPTLRYLTCIRGPDRSYADAIVRAINSHWPFARAYWERRPDWDSQPYAIFAHARDTEEVAAMRTLLFKELDRLKGES